MQNRKKYHISEEERTRKVERGRKNSNRICTTNPRMLLQQKIQSECR